MERLNRVLLRTTLGVMDLCWIYAWAGLTMLALLPRPFPLGASALSLGLGMALTRTLADRGLRRILILGGHLLGMVFAVFFTLHRALVLGCPLWDVPGSLRAMGEAGSPAIRLGIALASAWAMAFWVAGVRLGRSGLEKEAVWTRFDRGLLALFGVLLVEAFITVKLEIPIAPPLTKALTLGFFFSGLLATGLSGQRPAARRDYVQGFGGIGLLMSLGSLLLLATGLFMALFPCLKDSAQVGYAGVKAAAGGIEPYAVAVLRFVFAPRGRSTAPDAPARGGSPDTYGPLPAEASPWLDLLGQILAWGFLGLLGLLLFLAGGIGLWYLGRWLLGRAPSGQKDFPNHPGSRAWWLRLLRHLRGGHGGRQEDRVRHLFRDLLVWGGRSGVRRRSDETPNEYGARLSGHFPRLGSDIARIVLAFTTRVYGEKAILPFGRQELEASRKALSHPVHWVTRVRIRLDPGQGTRHPGK